MISSGDLELLSTLLYVDPCLMPEQTAIDTNHEPVSNPLLAYFSGGSIAWLAGINAYQFLPQLKSTHNDCAGLRETLEQKHGFKVNLLLDPGKQQFLSMLDQMKAACKADSRVIFYFAGHGVADGIDGEETPKGFLLPADAERGKYDTYIDMSLVMEALSALPARHLLIILDCCYAGAFRFAERTRSIGAEVPKTLYLQKFEFYVGQPARQVITSAASDQKAVDALGDRGNLNSKDRSPFAESLIQTLANGDADLGFGANKPDGIMTGSELGFYLNAEVSDRLSKNGIPLSDQQTPSIFRLGNASKGEFIFTHSPGAIQALKNIEDRNPYKGLDDYSTKESSLFYGRQRVLDGWWEGKIFYEGLLSLVKEEDATKLYRIIVTGRSGSGKSSLVKAGVLAALPPATVHTISPGSKPFSKHRDLLQTLASAPLLQYLLVDQYEELVTLCRDTEEANKFESMLANLATTKKAVIIVTIRSDIERRFNDSAFIGKEYSGKLYRFVVPPFTRREIKEVVMQPAAQQMLEFRSVKGTDAANEEFVNRIIDEAFANPDSLPLLSFALSRLYEKRDGIHLTEVEYDLFGGISGILDNKFTEAYNSYAQDAGEPVPEGPSSQDLFRQLVLRMISFDAGTMAKRRVYISFTSGDKTISELEFDRDDITKKVQAITEGLVQQRLLKTATEKDETAKPGTNDNAYIEPAHEALLRSSNLLAQWQGEKSASGMGFQNKVLLIRSLSNISQNYFLENDRASKKGLLWKHDPRLAYLGKLASSNELLLNRTEQSFVADSLRAKARGKIIGWLIVAFIFILISVAGVISFFQNKKLNEQLAQTYWSTALSAAAENDLLKSWLYLAEALASNSDEKTANLMRSHTGLFFPGYFLSAITELKQEILLFEFSKDEHTVVVICDSAALIIDVDSMKPVFEIPEIVITAKFNLGGNKLYLQSDSTVDCWNIQEKKLIHSFHTGNNAFAEINPGSNRVMINQGGNIYMLDSNLKRLSWTLEGDGAVLSPDATKLAARVAGSSTDAKKGNANFQVWNVTGLEPKSLLTEPDTYGETEMEFSPKGGWLVITGVRSESIPLVVLNVATRRKFVTEYRYNYNFAEFNEAEDRMLFADDDGDLLVINLQTYMPVDLSFMAHDLVQPLGYTFRDIEFLPQDSIYRDSVLLDKDEGAAFWNMKTGKMGTAFPSDGNYLCKSHFDVNRRKIISLSQNGHLRMFNKDGKLQGLSFITSNNQDPGNYWLSANSDHIYVAAGNVLYKYQYFDPNESLANSGSLRYASYSQNGKYQFTVDSNQRARIALLTETGPVGNTTSISLDELSLFKSDPTSPKSRRAYMPDSLVILKSVIDDTGDKVLIALSNGRLYLLDFSQGKLDSLGSIFNAGFYPSSNSLAFNFTNLNSVIFCGYDDHIYSYDLLLRRRSLLCRIPTDVEDIFFSGNAKQFIGKGTVDRTLSVYNIRDTSVPVAMPLGNADDPEMWLIDYLDSNRILTHMDSGRISVYNTKSGQATEFTALHSLKQVDEAFMTPDRNKLIVIYDAINLSVFDMQTRKLNFSTRIQELNNQSRYSLSLNKDCSQLAAVFDGKIFLYDVGTGKRVVQNYEPRFKDVARPIAIFTNYTLNYFDGAGIKIIGSDMDIPADLFRQEAIAFTGARLNALTNEPGPVPGKEQGDILKSYATAAAEHYRVCRFKQFNPWQVIRK